MLAAYIDQIIMFIVGAWATGVGYGFLPALGKDAIAQEQWKARFGKLLKIIGPLLVVIALALAGGQFVGARAAAEAGNSFKADAAPALP